MCKSTESRKRATQNFFDKLRGEAYSKPRALYEISDDGKANLIGFAAFVDDCLNFFKVVEGTLAIRCDGIIPYPAMGNNGICAYYGADYAELI